MDQAWVPHFRTLCTLSCCVPPSSGHAYRSPAWPEFQPLPPLPLVLLTGGLPSGLVFPPCSRLCAVPCAPLPIPRGSGRRKSLDLRVELVAQKEETQKG